VSFPTSCDPKVQAEFDRGVALLHSYWFIYARSLSLTSRPARRRWVRRDWNGAIAGFALAALRDPLNADIQNYIGYAYRRLRQMEPAMGHYQQALTLNPRHRGAREHLGEAYLVLGEPAKAEQMLTELENLCLIPCEEYDDLKQAIAVYRRLAAR
jgi:tetratricopeptide (TPR) repeat protein